MVDHLNVSYLYKKRGVYYFSKRVPCDVKSYYKSDRIVICLRTKSNVSAIRSSKSLYQKLDDYWTSIRLTKIQVPAEHMFSELFFVIITHSSNLHKYFKENFVLI